MSPIAESRFHNLSDTLSFEELIEELVKYIGIKPEAKYQIVVGSDSASSTEVRLVTAVAVHRIGNGGRYFWTRSEIFQCPTLRDRIYKETMQSIAFMQELRGRLKDRLGEEFFWDNKITVHLDVGLVGPTRELVDAVVGMVKGYGFDVAIKPDSFGAFVLADRHT